ncbi:MAG: VCBS domain-containing protein, partial [Methylococcaceae bacterium]
MTSPNPTLGALTAAITADTVGGSGGVLTWNYSVAAAAVEFLAQDEVRTEVFDVSFSDGKGGTLIKTVSVTLTGTNDVPVITAEDLSGAVLESVSTEGNLTDSGIINFSDVDLTDSHSVTEVTSPNPTLGTLTAAITADTVGGSGGVLTWNYSVAAAAVEFLAQDEVRTEVFDVSFSDGKGGTLIKTVNVTLTGTNDVPTFYLDSTGNADSASTTLVETNSGLTANGTLTLTDADTTDT